MTTTTDKVRARKALNHAVAAGRVIPQPCEKCGAAKAQGHHEDYAQPLRNQRAGGVMEAANTIQCRRCLEDLPAEPAFFYRDNTGRYAGGFRPLCKACYSETPCIVRRNAERAVRKKRAAVDQAVARLLNPASYLGVA